MEEKKNKGCDFELKEFNETERLVTFYFLSFNTVDSDGDIIHEKAADKWLAKYRDHNSDEHRRLKHLLDHDTTKTVGVIKNLGKDEKGLWVQSYIPPTTEGKDLFIKYKEGIVTEHSMGFFVLDAQLDERSGARLIMEIDLWEVSSLHAWGANKNTPVIAVKNLDESKKEVEVLKSKLEELESDNLSLKAENSKLVQFINFNNNLKNFNN